MLTRMDLRYRGSVQPGVSRIASMFKAAAERTMAPIFVGFTTSSRTAILLAPAHNS